MKAFHVDGTVDESPDIKTFNDAGIFIGGYITTVRVLQGLALCDEDGLMKGLPDTPADLGYPFVGNVLLLETSGEQKRILG